MLTKAFDAGYAAGLAIEWMAAKPTNPYKQMKQFNAWEYGFSHAQQTLRPATR